MTRNKPRSQPPMGECADPVRKPGWRNSPVALSILGALILWLALPPVGWSWLAWLAPLPWLRLVQLAEIPGRRFYWKVGVGGAVHWLLTLQGIRLAHPANYLGWLALSAYVGAYLPVFVVLTRRVVHVYRVPLICAAPILWTGLEWVRSNFLTGFAVALLGHSQYQQVWLIQISDLGGAYSVSFVMMVVAAALAEAWRGWAQPKAESEPPRFAPWLSLAVATVTLVVTAGYGAWRMGTTPQEASSPLQVALLQGTRDKVFAFNREFEERAFREYWQLMQEARGQSIPLDVIVWPESAFTEVLPDVIVDGIPPPPADAVVSPEEFEQRVRQMHGQFAEKVRRAAESANRVWKEGEFQTGNTALILGVESMDVSTAGIRQRNSALWCDPQGNIRQRYFKMHPVMFGEYVPFGRLFPSLYRLTPLRQGLEPGEKAVVFEIAGYRLSPSVCFESTVPHLIRRQVQELAAVGQAPDVLVNVSDDGWFWGSSILDLQLACGVFRAVELRRPFLVAANTGLTAAIDGNGAIQQLLERRQAGYLIASVHRDGRRSLYAEWGDWFPLVSLLGLTTWICLSTLRRTRRP